MIKGSKIRILEYIKHNGGITSMAAYRDLGITRLSARIKELRELGYNIDTVMINDINRFGEKVRYALYIKRGDSKDEQVIGD